MKPCEHRLQDLTILVKLDHSQHLLALPEALVVSCMACGEVVPTPPVVVATT